VDFLMQRRPCWVEISTSSFEHNYRVLAQQDGAGPSASGAPAVELLAIVKADAYGHGLALCAPAAIRAGARWLGVTSVEEGVAARGLCPSAEILVIGGPFRGQGASVLSHRLTPVVWEPWHMDELEAAVQAAGSDAGPIHVHLELDTGMSRQGVGASQLAEMLKRLGSGTVLQLGGVMTHLYAADESDGITTRGQFNALAGFLERIEKAGQHAHYLHVGNSAALLAGEVPRELQALCSRFGMQPMMRPGLALYGLAPEFSPQEPSSVAELRPALQPVMTWKTEVVSVRSIEAGQTVGYNGTFVATEPMRLALLAVGYADGLKRALSNRGAVLLREQRAPIVGRISMDQTVVDITDIGGVGPGDEVVLLGAQGAENIPAEEHAGWAGTIAWEILTSIAARVERRAFSAS